MICGIDLGTTFCAVAVVDPDGRPRVLENRVGERTTPSAVHFVSAREATVGAEALAASVLDPGNVVTLFKRWMGRDTPMEFHGVPHTPESVSAVLLRALAADARAALGRPADEAVSAVVTVPAYFGVAEREATALAADMAGIEVLELVAEPVAAGLSYDAGADDVLVYDLGGGTFDATVLRYRPDGVEVVATDGDNHLGGADVDGRLAARLLDRLAVGMLDDPRDDEALVAEARASAEAAKRALSSRTECTLRLRTAEATVALSVGRDELDELAGDLVERTMVIVCRLLDTAGVGTPDEVLLVGGSSRMPVVGRALTARLGRTPRLRDPDLAVAHGAAMRAHALTAPGRGRRNAVSVAPRGVGVLVRDSTDPAGLREVVTHLVPANTPLPARATMSFSTILDAQESVRVQVFEQAGPVPSPSPAHHRRVLDGELRGLSGAPAGARVDVTVDVDRAGRLAVTAREAGRAAALRLEAYVDGVADASESEALARVARGIVVR